MRVEVNTTSSRAYRVLLEIFDEINSREEIAFATSALALMIALTPKFGFIGIASVLVAFFPHELAHRQTARSLGCYSRFMVDPVGLAITLISTLLPIPILAPGYVALDCSWSRPGRLGELRIAASGPLVNIAIGVVGVVLYKIGFGWASILAAINSWIAIFNLIPAGPLDGAKIIRLNAKVWAAMTISAIIILWLSMVA